MKCELCNAGHREPEQKLCEPCIEAVARLWRIVNAPGPAMRAAGEGVDESMKSKLAAIAGNRPALFSGEVMMKVLVMTRRAVTGLSHLQPAMSIQLRRDAQRSAQTGYLLSGTWFVPNVADGWVGG